MKEPKELGSITRETPLGRIRHTIETAPSTYDEQSAFVTVNGVPYQIWNNGDGTFGCENMRGERSGRPIGIYRKTAQEVAEFIEMVVNPWI